jgi:hypothetical protein
MWKWLRPHIFICDKTKNISWEQVIRMNFIKFFSTRNNLSYNFFISISNQFWVTQDLMKYSPIKGHPSAILLKDKKCRWYSIFHVRMNVEIFSNCPKRSKRNVKNLCKFLIVQDFELNSILKFQDIFHSIQIISY